MSKNTKRVLLIVAVLVVLLIGGLIFKLIKDGFSILTYTTDNLLINQLEDIISEEEGQDYKDNLTSLGDKEFDGGYLSFYKINNSENNEYLIVEYEKKGNLGAHKIYNLKRIVKGDNSVAMIAINDGNRNKCIILSALDNKEYSSINILNKNTDELLDKISLEENELGKYEVKDLGNNLRVLEYIPKAYVDMKLEVIKKSGN